MDVDRFHGDSWTRASDQRSGGWAFHAYGKVRGSTRFWVRINDTRANCWDQ